MQMDVKRTENIIRYWVLLQEVARQRETLFASNPPNREKVTEVLEGRMKVLSEMPDRGIKS